MASSVRRRPNAFNLLHQLQFLCRGGLSSELAAEVGTPVIRLQLC